MMNWIWALLALRALAVNASSVECIVSVICGLHESGQPIDEHTYHCIDVNTAEKFKFDNKFTNKRYNDFLESFEDQNPTPRLRLIVPRDAVDEKTGVIQGDHEGITVPSNNAIRPMNSKELEGLDIAGVSNGGKHNFVLVTASDNAGHFVEHDKITLLQAFFGQKDGDDLSLSSVMKDCSNNELRIEPLEASASTILNIEFDYNFETAGQDGEPELIWDLAGKMAERFYAIVKEKGFSYSASAFIMPDIINFRGAAAYAGILGSRMWIKSKYALMPIVQVHEYGHLLGLYHAGKNGQEYGDPTCYMGNRLPWDTKGTSACFSGTKMSKLAWYDEYHTTINPIIGETFKGGLMGIDDASKGNHKGRHLIVELIGEKTPYHIMFNRKKGINNGQFESIDSVILTSAKNSGTTSFYRGEVNAAAKVWSKQDFGGTGQTLYVKFCSYSDQTDTANVLVYLEGIKNEPTCGGGGDNTGECRDDTAWSVGKGNTIDRTEKPCSWFNFNPSIRCNGYWSTRTADGKTAKQACCSCGGQKCRDDTAWSVGKGNTIDRTEKPCSWFNFNPSIRCNGYWSRRTAADGKTAKQACCSCGGGVA